MLKTLWYIGIQCSYTSLILPGLMYSFFAWTNVLIFKIIKHV
jgi:hypothetical protein